jgi:chromosome partitioning protein
MVDADLQCNLSYAMDYDFENSPNLYTALLGSTYAKPVDIKEYIVETKYKNLDMVGNTFGMATVDDDLYAKSFREQIMKNIFTPLLKEGVYDFIIFDCNPNLSITNKNIMHFSDSIIIPVELTPFGVMGMNVLLNFISNAKTANPKLEIFGILQANVDKRYSMNKLAQESLDVISNEFNVNIFKTIISTDSNVGKSQWERKPLGPYVKENSIYSRAREDFRNLANEVLERMKLENE